MDHRPLDVAAVRNQFPGLLRLHGDQPVVFCDGPAGSQVPARVAAAMADYLLHQNANHGGHFATSIATDAMVAEARKAGADLFGADDPEEVVFGANMTTLTFHLAHALARTWRRGEEIVVTDSDHDANVTPWVRAAQSAGCTVRRIPVRPDTTLDLDVARTLIGPRTRLVALGAASNLSGTVHPVAACAELAHRHGALVFVDAVHYAAHLRMDVRSFDADFVACSAYKFCGPHLGLLWGRRPLLEELEADKVRPAAPHGAEKWQTGTANFEAIAGFLATVQYLAELGHGGTPAPGSDRRRLLTAAFHRIAQHERTLCQRLLQGLVRLPGLRIVGITDPERAQERCSTVSLTHPNRTPDQLARGLAAAGIYAWSGHSYAVALVEALGRLPDGVLRLGLLHYHTEAEVDRVVATLIDLLQGP
jgi:cysteine desulfurase family protein (TIGR01976 family)